MDILFQSLVMPILLLGQLTVAFSWPAFIVLTGFIALIAGAIMALNHGTKAPRWVLLPLLVTHLQAFAYGQFATMGWMVSVGLNVLAIVWMLFKFRSAPLAGVMFAWFALVYGAATAFFVYVQINLPI